MARWGTSLGELTYGGHEGLAEAVPLEIKLERRSGPFAVVERFDVDARVRADRALNAVCGEPTGRLDLRDLLGNRALVGGDPTGSGGLSCWPALG
ncbi:hypothetical protein [Paenarthrobacter sp. 2TAF44]|uniref:hypothetical protein n=1 Tax=Paenarthrobacter sp. 2TAF44 TaxID=3233018 RepID=UPI003F96490A